MFLLDRKLEINLSIGDLVNILYPCLIVISSIWLTCYFMIFQFYMNRYLMGEIRKTFLHDNLRYIYVILFLILWGGILIGYKGAIFTS